MIICNCSNLGYFVISTHGNLHQPCIDFLEKNNFEILLHHTIDESFSGDGLIIAVNNINRHKIPPIKMIKLHKECAIKKITKSAKKVVALKLSEFTNALNSVDVREDGNICANVTFNLFFNSLNIGVKFSLRFAICDVPCELIGKLSEDTKTGFNFDDVDNDDYSVSVVCKRH